jgi:hypothetical protein
MPLAAQRRRLSCWAAALLCHLLQRRSTTRPAGAMGPSTPASASTRELDCCRHLLSLVPPAMPCALCLPLSLPVSFHLAHLNARGQLLGSSRGTKWAQGGSPCSLAPHLVIDPNLETQVFSDAPSSGWDPAGALCSWITRPTVQSAPGWQSAAWFSQVHGVFPVLLAGLVVSCCLFACAITMSHLQC